MLRFLKLGVATLVLALCVSSCDTFDARGFVSNPSDDVEARFAQSMAWNAGHRVVILDVPTDDYSYYVATDVHVDEDTKNVRAFLDAEQKDASACFSLFLGDFVYRKGRFDVFYPAMLEGTNQLKGDTVFAVVGNHDLYFDQWEDYKRCFGTSTYFFIVRTPNYKDLFIGLDSGSGTLAASQLAWLRNVLSGYREGCRHCTVFTHSNFYRNDLPPMPSGNFPEEETFELTDLFARNGVELVLTGHDHRHDVVDYRGVKYVVVEALKVGHATPGYLVVHAGDFLDLDFRSL